jgi:hypothetical protein
MKCADETLPTGGSAQQQFVYGFALYHFHIDKERKGKRTPTSKPEQRSIDGEHWDACGSCVVQWM